MIFLWVTLNVFSLASSLTRKAEIHAFVNDKVAEEPGALLQMVANIAGITAVGFVSKSEAREELIKELDADSTLLNVLGDNPIPASIRLSLHPDFTSEKDINAIEQKLRLLPGITEVWSGKGLLTQLNQAAKTVVLLDILILVIVAVSVVFIAFQSVENSIINRAHEIEIMELVGAPLRAIRIPFILQGVFQGILGGAVAFVMILLIYRVIISFIPAPIFPIKIILITTITLGMLFGLGGSILALSRLPTTLKEVPFNNISRC